MPTPHDGAEPPRTPAEGVTPAADADLLTLGPAPRRPTRRRLSIIVGAVLVVLVVGLVAWRLVPPAPADFTSSDLEGVYGGMVRSDGQNEVSVLTRANSYPAPIEIAPEACVPLFTQTLGNAFPEQALDGVSTYWLNEASMSISLFTYRYADSDAAEREFTRVQDALAACRPAGAVTSGGKPVTLEAVTTTDDDPPQLAYLVTGSTGRFATQVFQLQNTVTWQYRYDYADGPYVASASQQLTVGLVSQMTAVQQMRTDEVQARRWGG